MLWHWPLLNHHMATNWTWVFLSPPDDTGGPCDPAPTASEFKARFPEFATLPDAHVTLVLAEAATWVDSSWVDCKVAAMYMAAHLLALQSLYTETLPIDGGGSIRQVSFREMRVSFSDPEKGKQRTYDMESTPYGSMYMQLLKVNKPAVLVV
jgi:hypothetical protein